MYLIKTAKSPYWQILYKNELGKYTTKSTQKISKSEALIFFNEFKLSYSTNKKPFVYKTLKDFESEYSEVISAIRSKSYKESIDYAFKLLVDFTGNILFNQFNQVLAEKFISHIYSKSKHSAALYYRTLKAAFEKAREWNYFEENPFAKFKLPRLPHPLPVFIDYNELNKIIKETKSRLLQEIFMTAFLTGLRLGELLNLTRRVIDLDNKIIRVENTNIFTTKNKRDRIVPINKNLFELLSSRVKRIRILPDEYLFYKCKGIKLNNDYVSKNFKKAVRAAELDDRIHFHSLRHSFASVLVQNGVSLYIVKELLGHQDITTTQIYAHIRSENLFEAVSYLVPENLFRLEHKEPKTDIKSY